MTLTSVRFRFRPTPARGLTCILTTGYQWCAFQKDLPPKIFGLLTAFVGIAYSRKKKPRTVPGLKFAGE
jgi:hypothetical protein